MKAFLFAAALLLPAGLAHAASHSDAPMVSIDLERADKTTDVYVFEPERKSRAAGVTGLGSKSVGSVGAPPRDTGRTFSSSGSVASSSAGN